MTDLISRARLGDGDASRSLTEPHRRELQVHCYRMLGSIQDAGQGPGPALGLCDQPARRCSKSPWPDTAFDGHPG